MHGDTRLINTIKDVRSLDIKADVLRIFNSARLPLQLLFIINRHEDCPWFKFLLLIPLERNSS